MSNAKLFRFTAENMTTRETAAFIGQGVTVKDAFAEAIKNAADAFRPSTSGAKRPEHGIAVTLPSGRVVGRTVSQFESDTPFEVSAADNEGVSELVEVDV
jgi:hypothetical protein